MPAICASQAAELMYTMSLRLPLDDCSALLAGDVVGDVVLGRGGRSALLTPADLTVEEDWHVVDDMLDVSLDFWVKRTSNVAGQGGSVGGVGTSKWAALVAQQLAEAEQQLGPAQALQQPWATGAAALRWNQAAPTQTLLSRSISMAYIGGGMHIAGRYDSVWRWALICGMPLWEGAATQTGGVLDNMFEMFSQVFQRAGLPAKPWFGPSSESASETTDSEKSPWLAR